jgi:hypothetical protein
VKSLVIYRDIISIKYIKRVLINMTQREQYYAAGLCREFYLGGHEGAVALVYEGITPPESRTVQPQYGLRLPPRPPAAVS